MTRITSNYHLTIMDKEFRLRHDVSDMILAVADEQQDETRSDLQGRTEIVGRNIIHRVREDVIEELAKLKRGIEADNFTKENIDALVVRLRRV